MYNRFLRHNIIVMIITMAILSLGNWSFAANYPLEIIQPRAGLDTKNRFYKAYPGLEYNVRLAVIGGAYPFTYALTTAPTGMTINPSTGEIIWPDPTATGSPHSVTATVVDQEGTSATVSWTITVTTTGFLFLDSGNGKTCLEGGTGTISNPYKEIKDIWTDPTDCSPAGDTLEAKHLTDQANKFLYFRTGTYQMNAYRHNGGNRMIMALLEKPVVWMAYPGETVNLDMTLGFPLLESGANNAYFDGFNFINIVNGERKALQMDVYGGNVTIRRNSFAGLPTSTGSNNQSAIFLSAGNSYVSNWSIQDNTFSDIRHGYGVLGYQANKTLIEDNTFHDFSDPEGQGGSHVIGAKESTTMWFIRRNVLYNIYGAGITSLYSNIRGDTDAMEISYNLVINIAGSSLVINKDNFTTGGEIYVFRNTFAGGIEFWGVSSTNGPFYAYQNVVVNGSSALQHIDCLSCSDPTRLTMTNNLSGVAADNIIDSNGNLTAAYSSYVGTYGYQIDLGNAGSLVNSTKPEPPSNLRVQ